LPLGLFLSVDIFGKVSQSETTKCIDDLKICSFKVEDVFEQNADVAVK
jgi:hypothetical protein